MWLIINLLTFFTVSLWSILVALHYFKSYFSRFSQFQQVLVSERAEFSEFAALLVTSFPLKME